MTKFLSILIAVSLSLSAFSRDTSLTKKVVLENYLATLKELQKQLSPTSSCSQEVIEGDSSNKCTFQNFCATFAPYSNSPILYQNEKGEKIHNYSLMQVKSAIDGCYRTTIQAMDEQANLGKNDEFQKVKKEALGKGMIRRRVLLDYLQKNKLEKDWIRFETALLDDQIAELTKSNDSKVEDGSFDVNKLKTPDEARAELDKTLRKYSINFPKALIDLYVKGLTTDYEVLTAYQKTKQNPELEKLRIDEFEKSPFFDVLNLIVTNPLRSKETVLANQKKFDQQVDRAQGIFTNVQKRITAVLQNAAQKNPSKKDVYTQMAARINTIQYYMLPEHPSVQNQVCPGPNAFYTGQAHIFVLCPQILELPTAGLEAIIAHELGHSIDPCTMAGDLINIQGDEPPSQLPVINVAPGFEVIPYKLKLKEEKKNHYRVDMFGQSPKQLGAGYADAKVSLAQAHTDLKNNPFTSVIECLSSQGSLGARLSAKDQSKKELDQGIQKLIASGATPENNNDLVSLIQTRKNFDNVFERYGACSFLPGNSQIQEAFSDWLAGEVLGLEVENFGKNAQGKSQAKISSFESFGYFLAADCGNLEKDSFKVAEPFLKKMECLPPEGDGSSLMAISGAHARNQDVHSHGADRVERVFLQQPKIRAALGCGPADKTKGTYCAP